MASFHQPNQHQRAPPPPPPPPPPPTMINPNIPSAVPTLKVMRIQAPELATNTKSNHSITDFSLSNSLILPDSFGVIHIGETFTAYLGALNISSTAYITNLSVCATLQTPTRRFPLPSPLEDTGKRGIHVDPLSGVDAIVSRSLEEVGQHILRVEVSYGGSYSSSSSSYNSDSTNPNTIDNPNSQNIRKSLRKFYRFHVSSPLHIRELTLRSSETSCFVSLAVENASPPKKPTTTTAGQGPAAAAAATPGGGGRLTICKAEFQSIPGLKAERIQSNPSLSSSSTTPPSNNNPVNKSKSAVELFDQACVLEPAESYRYLFAVKAATKDATLRGIASGDELGKAILTWTKAMGEAGRIASTFVFCPPNVLDYTNNSNSSNNNSGTNTFKALNSQDPSKEPTIIYGSGLSVDVAASVVNRSIISHAPSEIPNQRGLEEIWPITVEPLEPPSNAKLGIPFSVKLLIINHGSKSKDLQLQMRLREMKGVVICGPSFISLGDTAPNGSHIASINLIAVVPGLLYVKGCYVMDLNTGLEVPQPALFSIFVDNNTFDNE